MITSGIVVGAVLAYLALGALSGRLTFKLVTWLYDGETPGAGDITPRGAARAAFFLWPLTWAIVAFWGLVFVVFEAFTALRGVRLAQRVDAWMTRKDNS